MSQPRSDIDTKVHHRGRRFAHLAKHFPIYYGAPTFESEDQLEVIRLAKMGLSYYKARHEQDMENLTNQFAKLSINDVSVTDVFPLAR